MKKEVLLIVCLLAIMPSIFSCSQKRQPASPDTAFIGSISGQVQVAPFKPCCYYNYWYNMTAPNVSSGIVYVNNQAGGVTRLNLPTPEHTDIPTATPTLTPTPALTWDATAVVWDPILPGPYYPGCPTSVPTPYQGAVVTAFQSGTPVATAVTGADGRYLIDGLIPGKYDLAVRIPSYDVDYSMRSINVRSSVESAEHNLARALQWQPGKLNVQFKSGISQAACEQIIATRGCTKDNFLYYVDLSGNTVYSYEISIPQGSTPDEEIGQFMQLAETDYCSKLYYFQFCNILY